MNQFKKQTIWIACVALLAGACKKGEQNVAPTSDNEAITTAMLTLTNKANPSEVVTATVDNLNTTADFSKATLNLKANTTYTGAVGLLDKTRTPALDATVEIRGKLNEHLFIYTPTPANLLTITLTDKDTNPAPGPYPVGLATEIKTGAVGSGKLKLVLRHQPGVKNGTATPGTTDLDTDFPVVVK